MNVLRSDDPAEFAALTRAFLLEHEAENCFFLGHLPTLRNPTDVLLLAATDADTVHAVALMTPGRHMVMTRGPAEAVAALTKYLHAQRIAPPGFQAPRDVAEAFAREWTSLTGAAVRSPVGMGIHRLTRVIPPARRAPGAMRTAQASDVDLLARWGSEFCKEIGEAHFADHRAIAEKRVADGAIVIWEDGGQPVAMAGSAGATPNGIRVNLVYTPRPFRNRGYASSLVATLSQRLLDSGRRFCFLYTDLANPTSNRIYREIGYVPIGETVRFVFE